MCRMALWAWPTARAFPSSLPPVEAAYPRGTASEVEFQALRQVSPSTQCAEPASPLADLRVVRSFHHLQGASPPFPRQHGLF